MFLSGYYPVLAFPPARQSRALAESFEQKQEITAQSFPQPVSLPHSGYLSTKFSRWHPGIDIAAGLGVSVYPVNPGTVERVSVSWWGLGNNVIISHPNGFRSTYGHLGKIFVKAGQEINSETALAEVGVSGNTSGPHTHLEIQKDGKSINPADLLPEIPPLPKL
ncbi:M23 family metallopeptidase [Candidatus Daviesbacteria bacterium]|nr:M23 family metallopeptidase [Candidatus Daviesbacteria bacterium]